MKNSHSRPTKQVISSETLKSVVKRVVEEEDRSRNVIVFGLSEGSDSDLIDTVSEIFQNIGQKPKIVEACRIGRTFKGNSVTARSVKVKVVSSIVVDQLVANTKNLRITEKITEKKTVFVCPDRSTEKRQIQRDLLLVKLGGEAKEKDKVFFIKS